MTEFKNYEEFTLNYQTIPKEIALDVFKRVCDWLGSGGNLADGYVKKQLNYASKFIAKG